MHTLASDYPKHKMGAGAFTTTIARTICVASNLLGSTVFERMTAELFRVCRQEGAGHLSSYTCTTSGFLGSGVKPIPRQVRLWPGTKVPEGG